MYFVLVLNGYASYVLVFLNTYLGDFYLERCVPTWSKCHIRDNMGMCVLCSNYRYYQTQKVIKHHSMDIFVTRKILGSVLGLPLGSKMESSGFPGLRGIKVCGWIRETGSETGLPLLLGLREVCLEWDLCMD